MKLQVLTLLLAPVFLACGSGSDAECETSEYNCDGTILQECGDDGMWVDSEDCADLNMVCHAEMGHCMAGDTEEDMSDSGMGEE